MLPIVYHPDYQAPLRRGHRFPMSKYGYLREALLRRGLFDRTQVLSPAPARAAQLELAHAADYVRRALALALDADEVRRIGLPCTEQVIRRSRLSAAGTTLAAWLAMETGLACNCAGGSHHAGPDGGAGFCVFNDVAVAIRNLRAQGLRGTILVVDADVHQGDGTAAIFARDDSVFTLSIHAERNFPHVKQRSDLDIALPDGTSGSAYLGRLKPALTEVLESFCPVLVFYNAGVDVHRSDRLGRLALGTEDVRARDRLVIDGVRRAGAALTCVLGGGYSNDPQHLADLHAILFEEAAAALAGLAV